MSDLTVTWDQVRRFTLTRQHLMARADAGSMVRVIGDLCGLQSQVKLAPEHMLWARVESFRREELAQALFADKSLVRLWLMRATIHIIPTPDLPMFYRAMRRAWEDRWIRWMDDRMPRARRQALYPLIWELLNEPGTRQELQERVRARQGPEWDEVAHVFGAWGGILKEMSGRGMVVHGPEVGAEVRFCRLDRWLPDVRLDAMSEGEALAALLLRYLAGYGPATAQDFTYWTALDAGAVKEALRVAGHTVAQVHIEGEKATYLVRRQDLADLAATDADAPIPFRLLPRFDVLILGHKDKRRVVPPEHLRKVCALAGDIRATVLVNGRVAGTWSYQRNKGGLVISISFFGDAPVASRDEIAAEAERLAAWWNTGVHKIDVG